MLIKAVDHIAINTVNIDESLHFYSAILGMPKLGHIAMSDHDLYYLGLPTGQRLELIVYHAPGHVLTIDSHHVGIFRHIALLVDDVQAIEELMQSQGIRVTQSATYVPSLNVQSILVRDPNGVELEFIQKTLPKIIETTQGHGSQLSSLASNVI